ncbi:MAG: cysteine desulfurase [archaeon]|jgi:cysteine desulfurase/selenocysteine lyase|nr:cysteine desulfurase [archaeon]
MNVDKIRKDFAILNGKNPPIYFDNACTTFRPNSVLGKMNEYYEQYPSCAGRSNHRFGTRVTEELIKARRTVADFFNAKKESEIVFTRNTTEGINLIANALGLKKGEIVLTSDKEHNSNLIPWLVKAKSVGIRHETFKFGDLGDFEKKIKNVRLVSVVHTSNVDGTTQDVKEMAKIAHENNAVILVDAAQSAPHKPIDVRKLDIDFLVCSGHKMLGPSGMGILYGKQELLEKMDYFMAGGETVTNSTYTSFVPEKVPEKFEAGLQNYAGIIGFAEALRYLKKVGLGDVEKHEHELNKRLSDGLLKLGVKILGPEDAKLRGGVAGFNVGKMNPHEVSLMLDSYNIAIRSGMHCVHSWFNANKLAGSARASLYLYNTKDEVDFFLEKMKDIAKLAR